MYGEIKGLLETALLQKQIPNLNLLFYFTLRYFKSKLDYIPFSEYFVFLTAFETQKLKTMHDTNVMPAFKKQRWNVSRVFHPDSFDTIA